MSAVDDGIIESSFSPELSFGHAAKENVVTTMNGNQGKMKKFRLLMHGRNYMLKREGKRPGRHEFYLNVFLESSSLSQAELLVKTRLVCNSFLKENTLNPKDDPPLISLEMYWELDDFGYPGERFDDDFLICEEKKWWQFWK